MIDTHTHLELFARRGETADVLARAKEVGVSGLITIGTGPDDWELYRGLAAGHPGYVFHSVGLHPCSVTERWSEDLAGLEDALAADPSPVALGECGLDRFHLPKDPSEAEKVFRWQRSAFAAQLEMARRVRCPLVVHSRGAFAECVAMIDASGIDWARVVFHCFVEGEAEMKVLLSKGAVGSFTGVLTYKSAANVRAALRLAGPQRTFFETDAPYLTPEPHRGKENQPSLIVHTVQRAAAELGVSFEELVHETDAHARRFFSLPSR